MQFQNEKEKGLIVDFGSQVTKLIARRVRELGVFSEIITPKNIRKLKKYNNIKGLILSGGPSTVTKKKFQSIPDELFKKGICGFLECPTNRSVLVINYYYSNTDGLAPPDPVKYAAFANSMAEKTGGSTDQEMEFEPLKDLSAI